MNKKSLTLFVIGLLTLISVFQVFGSQGTEVVCYVASGTFNECGSFLRDVTISPDGSEVWVGGENGDMWRWDTSNIPDDYKIFLPILASDSNEASQHAIANPQPITSLFSVGNWQKIPAVTSKTIRIIDAIGENDVWAAPEFFANIEDDAELYHWNGSSWEIFTLPGIRGVTSFDFIGTSSGFAILSDFDGNNFLANWNGSIWQTLDDCQIPDTIFLNDLSTITESNVWLVGGDTANLQSSMAVHWDGNECRTMVVDTEKYQALQKIHALNENAIWAGGEHGRLYFYNGANWENRIDEVNAGHVLDIDMVDEENGIIITIGGVYLRKNGQWVLERDTHIQGFFLGGGAYFNDNSYVVFHEHLVETWDGSSWRSYESDRGFPDDVVINGIEMISADKGFAVGGKNAHPELDGITALKWDGSDWQQMAVPEFNSQMNAISVLSENDIWAVGAGPSFMHYDGLSWELSTGFDFEYQGWAGAVDTVSANSVWAIGASIHDAQSKTTIYHWDGAMWSRNFVDTHVRFPIKIEMISDELGWFNASDTLYKWDGVEWKPDLINSQIIAFDVIAQDDIIVGGSGGLLLRFDGRDWNQMNLPPDIDENCTIDLIEMQGPDSGWGIYECGFSETGFMQWDGLNWTANELALSETVTGVGVVSADKVWLTVYDSPLLYIDTSD